MAPQGKDASNSAPLKDQYRFCAARFYAKQQYGICSARCNRKFHCKCWNIGLEIYNIFMKSGTSTFNCTDCTRRHNVSPNPDNDTAVAHIDNSASTSFAASTAEQESPYVSAGLLRVIDNMASKLDVVTAELKCLRAEYRSLPSEVLQLRKTVLDRIIGSPSPPQPYATVTASTSRPSPVAPSPIFVSPALEHQRSLPASRPNSVNPVERGPAPSATGFHAGDELDGRRLHYGQASTSRKGFYWYRKD